LFGIWDLVLGFWYLEFTNLPTSMKESRPKTELEITSLDKILEVAGWLALAVLWGYTLNNYSHLPETIPTHFNALGEVDSYGGKATILILPILGTVLIIGMSVLNKFPHVFNFPVKITPENASKQYTMATRMIRYLKFAIALIFIMIQWAVMSAVNGGTGGPGIWLLPLTLAILFIPLGYFIYKSFKAK
jgi:uncharacterized membrane protein